MLPIEAFRDCFLEIRQRIKERHRQYVGWRVLCRTIAADDGFLSPYQGRDTMTISFLQNNTLPYKEYFEDIEHILRSYGGRPHWGKQHTLKAGDLPAPLPDVGPLRGDPGTHGPGRGVPERLLARIANRRVARKETTVKELGSKVWAISAELRRTCLTTFRFAMHW